ncbi:MAG: hypothetical protein AAGD10_11555 [Myxococcota bacterium]
MLASLLLVSLLNQAPAAKFKCPLDAERKVEQRPNAIAVYCLGPNLVGGVAKNGPYLELRPDDRSPRWAGSYINGRPDGNWRRFDRQKNVVERRVYRNGRLLSRTLEEAAEGVDGRSSAFGDEDLSEFEGPDEPEAQGGGLGPQGALEDTTDKRGLTPRYGLSEDDFQAQHHGFANSVGGLVQGDSVFGVGATVLYFVPTLDLRYRYGLAKPIAFDVRLSTIGIFNRLHLGLRSRLFGDERFSLFLDTQLASNAFFFPGGSGIVDVQGFDLAGIPGLGVSFGGPRVQLSLGAQVPLYFFEFITSEGLDASDSFLSPRIRPFIGLDVVAGEKTSIYATLEVEADLDPSSLASLSEATFFWWSIGVAFDLHRRKSIY